MKAGDKIIYGVQDPENLIECTFKKCEITPIGEVIIYADCEGGTIVAPWEMFKKAQPKRSTPERQLRTGRRGSDDGRPERKNMKDWTIEELYDLWRYRGYTKKEARAKAEKDYKEMHLEKSETEQHKIMQEMIYN